MFSICCASKLADDAENGFCVLVQSFKNLGNPYDNVHYSAQRHFGQGGIRNTRDELHIMLQLSENRTQNSQFPDVCLL